MICGNCKHWHRVQGAVGQCRALPPQLITVPARLLIKGRPPYEIQSHYPQTANKCAACSLFSPALESEPKAQQAQPANSFIA